MTGGCIHSVPQQYSLSFKRKTLPALYIPYLSFTRSNFGKKTELVSDQPRLFRQRKYFLVSALFACLNLFGTFQSLVEKSLFPLNSERFRRGLDMRREHLQKDFLWRNSLISETRGADI